MESPLDSDVTAALRRASADGAVFVAYSRMTGVDKDALGGFFAENGISVSAIVDGCTWSKNRILIESRRQLEELAMD